MRSIRILLADDHTIVRKGLRMLLESNDGFHVVAEAADGREAVALAEQHQPDIVVMDLRMPGTGGVQATIQIRKEFPRARIIVLTTYEGDEDIHRALDAGAQAYLLKDAVRK